MSWLGGIGAGLSSLGQSMQKREEEKRSREERLNAIRDKLSLVNAQAPEKRRVIPGQELPDGVAGPPAPEMVETFQTKLTYDPENGYVPEDKVLRSERNQWSTTDRSIKAAGGKVIDETEQEDLAGRKRREFAVTDAPQKLSKETIIDGGQRVDVMMNEAGEIVNELGRGERYKPSSAGRSPEEIQAAIDYRDKLARGRIDLAEKFRQDRYVGNFTAGEIDAWRGLKGTKREEYNARFGLPPNATEQQVRNAIRQRAIEDRSAPAPVVPDPAPTPVPESESPFKRREGQPEPKPNPMAKDDPKPKADKEKPADKPKEEPNKESKNRAYQDDAAQKRYEEHLAKANMAIAAGADKKKVLEELKRAHPGLRFNDE